MNMKIIMNDYMLAWNILFQASISNDIHNLKQKLWTNYRKEYNRCGNDGDQLLEDYKNFIPDDDRLYNITTQNDFYKIIRRDVEKYRMYVLRYYDQNKKTIDKFVEKVCRMPLPRIEVLLIHPGLDTTMSKRVTERKIHIAHGKMNDVRNPINFISNILKEVIRNECSNQQLEQSEMVEAVLELAIDNELVTELLKVSTYGSPSKYGELKRQLYPYWLMFLGADKEDMLKYMMRDKIAFDVDKYVVEKQLKKVDLIKFIDFCIKSYKYLNKRVGSEIDVI